MPATNPQVAFLIPRCAGLTDLQVMELRARAMGANAVHQAGGRFYMAELCEQRAADLLAVIEARQAVSQ